MSEKKAIIKVTDLYKTFGDLKVLNGVSLSAYAGQVISIIGTSGSGKSTLLRCINLLEYSDSGEILFEDEKIIWENNKNHRIPANKSQVIRHRTKISMVFQQFNLWSHMNVMQNIIEAPISVLGKSKKEAQEKAIELLQKVDLYDKAYEYPLNLSGGQQQRAAIARALAMEPDVILFDEPTSALDPELEQEVIQVIKNLAEEGRTMILVTHDMKLAKDVSNYILFINNGLIAEEGDPDSIFKNTKTERLKKFLESTNSN
jgi:polar amino acid transport system ATP-binding protein